MRQILFLASLLTTSFAFGQKLHELKTDLVLPFFNTVHLAYEFNPEGCLGMEANLWYRWAEPGYYYIPPPAMLFSESIGTYIPTEQQVLIYTVAAKYYFSKQRNGTGLYLGGYFRQDVLMSHPDDRYEYFTLNTYSLSYNQDIRNKKTLRFGLGALGGYKRLIGKHLIMEVGMGIDLNMFQKIDFGNDYLDWMGIPSVKAGYRFL